VELIVQPADGAKPVLDTIAQAQKSIDIMIFRFDLKAMEKELEAARARGVVVRALIAHQGSQGEKNLRQLELRMLAKGILVARTGDAFTRYHGKMMVVDREELHVYGFNFTSLDLKSRSFGIVTKDRKAVTEAIRVFEADTMRQEYEPQEDGSFVVSPENAREQLATFIKRARKQLVIWDPKINDPQMIRLILQRMKAGVDVTDANYVGLAMQWMPTGSPDLAVDEASTDSSLKTYVDIERDVVFRRVKHFSGYIVFTAKTDSGTLDETIPLF